jgi:hypothetical protein
MDLSLKEGGIMAYDKFYWQYRGRTARFVNKNVSKDKKAPPETRDIMHFVIDGEDLLYRNYVKFEVEY